MRQRRKNSQILSLWYVYRMRIEGGKGGRWKEAEAKARTCQCKLFTQYQEHCNCRNHVSLAVSPVTSRVCNLEQEPH